MRRVGSNLRALCSKLAMVAASIALALIGAEIALRVFSNGPLFPRFVTHRVLQGGPTIRQNLPGAHYVHSSPDGQWEFSINANGFRSDRDYSYAKPPGHDRVLVLGDSFTIGYEVSLSETYAHVLQHQLKNHGLASVEVLNAGMSGMGTAEEFAFFMFEGIRYDPDILVLGVYANDVADTWRSGLYELAETGVVPKKPSYIPAIEMANRLYRVPGYFWLAQQSHLYAFLNERAGALVKTFVYSDSTASRLARSREPARELVASLLTQMIDEAASRGISVILLDIASRDHQDSVPVDLISASTEFIHLRTSSFYTDCCPEEGVFRRHGHHHWTPSAHRAAGIMLADAIVTHGLLSPRNEDASGF